MARTTRTVWLQLCVEVPDDDEDTDNDVARIISNALNEKPLPRYWGTWAVGSVTAFQDVNSTLADEWTQYGEPLPGTSEPCDECGAEIPDAEPGMVSESHEDSCSLHTHAAA